MLRLVQGGKETGKGREDFFASLHFNLGEKKQENSFFFGFPSRRTSSLHLLFEEQKEERREGIRNKRVWVLPRAESKISTA